jgi:DMSO/TMAO reductase YedYZ molybdopterin-dependent catalytic subunit
VRAPGRALKGAFAGLVAAGLAIGVAQLVAGLLDPHTSPILTVGQATIDLTPEGVKAFAIRTFGEQDKTVLLGGIALVLGLFAVGLGIWSLDRIGLGLAALLAFGAIGVLAALTRPSADPIDALPAIGGTIAGGAGLVLLMGAWRSDRERAAATVAGADPESHAARRFLLLGAIGAVVAVAASGAGSLLGRRFRADDSRAAVRIPTPVSRARPAANAELSVPGLGPFFTPNPRFYRVDTALLVPAVMAEDWRLRIHGMVDREIQLDFEQLLARPLIERDITLTCVSNPVGGRYAGNARWIGVPLRELLAEAGPHPRADQIVTRSVDGFTVGTPTSVVTDGRDAMLAVAMNGYPLPLEHGFPVRMLVPGLYGYVSATKWLTDMELTTFDAFDPYWVRRGWAEQAPIKTMSRIDTPTSFLEVPSGEVSVAGVAWAQHVGVDRVEVRVDGDAWQEAELAGEDTVDTWRQWVFRWAATTGEHRLQARATDRSGAVQTDERAEPFPDGASGHHTIVVRVT